MCWIVSAAGSLFRGTTVGMLRSHPQAFICPLALGPYALSVATAYLTLSVTKLIHVLSPVTFQNLSPRKGFWISLFATIFLPLSDMVLIQTRCGLHTKELNDPFEYKIIFKYELGMLNEIFGRVENFTEFTDDDENAFGNMTNSTEGVEAQKKMTYSVPLYQL